MGERGAGSALVAGGSIGGLFAAAALLKAGWSVRVFERVGIELAGRGAGIVTHEPLSDALHAVGASTADLGVAVQDRVAFDISGAVITRMRYPQIVTSWDRVHQILRRLMPEGAYQLGCAVTGYRQDSQHVTATFDDGSTEEADILVGADGFRSAVRAQMLPDVQPAFAGYVVWRAVTDEASLSGPVHDTVFREFGLFAPNGTQIIGYPIAGVGNDLRPGHRRYNFVWYSAVTPDELRDMLTDGEGRHHPVSIPPPLIRDDVLCRMEDDARRRLPPAFVEILQQSERPFFTPIYDHCSPSFADGRVALAGDAACVARPHVGMGVTKAAEDALALARHLGAAPIADALDAYSRERVPASHKAYKRAQRLGSFIFDGPAGQNLDGRGHPDLDTIMRDTAVPVT
ncbi:MAG: FAD-dependent monooxygenase [Alphaproteobacteria bacterium]|nr:FAD-dependent monooxygenase [Alphaproteobacteria bacterium]